MSLSGSICALATPFHSRDDTIDGAALQRLIDLQVAGGTRALVVAGSTGEAAALDEAEFSQLLALAVRHIGQRVPSIAGTGQSGTQRTIAQTRRARDAGIEYALVVAPAYVRPTQEGMYRHFCEVADHGGLPVMLYNVPSRTACDLLPETVARLTAHGNIIGIKEAVADPARMQALLPLRSERFSVFSGDDGSAASAMLAGADGVVSVAANVDPARMARLAEACADHSEVAAVLERELQPLFTLLGCEPNPIPLKWCLSRMGIGEPHLRLPLLPLGTRHHAHADSVLVGLGLVEPAAVVG